MDGLLAAFAAASKSYFYPAVCAVTEIGLCGENAATQMRANGTGLGSFHTYFMEACLESAEYGVNAAEEAG